ncbi:MAG: hypothetical protein A2086_13665 [Spirochaetes bacterium GWD1_27_9]|nr:MAG: hypothetical protein A2Z98_02520 [Spirochaetes bacterium GWB1_27_13]OHD22600.1 MAG: hypothetical protein A2Y34_07485 [Spirochaetes bacterium GWC1_27_15]OHD30706.1 MAG: hypothetical protein A2086_13665 [Spirochaetes bacterium GWD1_27_9]
MIDKQTIEKILDMSRIDIADESKEKFINQVQNIIIYVDKINSLDTNSIKDRESPFDEKDIMDEDLILSSYSQPDLRKYTKNYLDGYYFVPKIIEKN